MKSVIKWIKQTDCVKVKYIKKKLLKKHMRAGFCKFLYFQGHCYLLVDRRIPTRLLLGNVPWILGCRQQDLEKVQLSAYLNKVLHEQDIKQVMLKQTTGSINKCAVLQQIKKDELPSWDYSIGPCD